MIDNNIGSLVKKAPPHISDKLKNIYGIGTSVQKLGAVTQKIVFASYTSNFIKSQIKRDDQKIIRETLKPRNWSLIEGSFTSIKN